MKKILLILAVVSVAGLAMWGWAQAQESEKTSAVPASPPAATFDSLYQQGKQLKEAGDYQAALPPLLAALEKDPNSEPTHILAGVCLKERGQVREALGHFETVVAGKGFRATALYCAAECHRALGEKTEALADLKAAHEDSPIDKWGIKAVGLMAEIEGQSPAEAMAREEEAAKQYRAARDRARETSYKSPEPLAMFDRVIARFPGTGGAYCALTQKAELLWHLGKREEMGKTYEQLRAILRGYAGTEKVRLAYRTMDCRIGQHRAEQMLRELGREQADGREVSQEKWDRLQVLCNRWRHNADDADRARADAFIILVAQVQLKREEVVEKVNSFLQQYYESDKNRIMDEDYKDVFAGAHLMAGYALRGLGRYEEALSHFRAIIDMSVATPPLRHQSYIPTSYYQICSVLREMRAPQTELQQAVEEFASACPEDRGAEALRQWVESR